MTETPVFYICPMCFRVSETQETCHDRPMLACDAGSAGDERRKPLMDNAGQIVSRAPRWFIEACEKGEGAVFYICPTCFRVSEQREECHGRQMICCDACRPGAVDLRKPEVDQRGALRSRAPRWFRQATTRRGG